MPALHWRIIGPETQMTNKRIGNTRRHFLGLTAAAAGKIATAAGAVSTVVSASTAKALGRNPWQLPGKNGGDNGPNCFLKGTVLDTSTGAVAIETLQAGDSVMTADGRHKQIMWIGRRRYKRSGVTWQRHVVPVRIAAHALAANVPSRDLYVSPAHALLIDGYLIKAIDLVNGVSVTHDQLPGDEIEYFHIALDSHEAILAEGTPVETLFVEPGMHENFSNGVEFARLYPLSIAQPMRRFAPEVGYDARIHMKALLRVAFGGLAPPKADAERIYDKIADRAI